MKTNYPSKLKLNKEVVTQFKQTQRKSNPNVAGGKIVLTCCDVYSLASSPLWRG